jgi:hypothetical protein
MLPTVASLTHQILAQSDDLGNSQAFLYPLCKRLKSKTKGKKGSHAYLIYIKNITYSMEKKETKQISKLISKLIIQVLCAWLAIKSVDNSTKVNITFIYTFKFN